MTVMLTFALEIGLCILLAATLVYCVVLERRLMGSQVNAVSWVGGKAIKIVKTE